MPSTLQAVFNMSSTLQAVFNKVVNHLRTQNAKSMSMIPDRKLTCAYRGDNGCKCAVGCLIDDAHYSPSLEGTNVESLRVRSALIKSGIDIDGNDLNVLHLLYQLQQVHDFQDVENWERGFLQVALNFDLILPPKETPQ